MVRFFFSLDLLLVVSVKPRTNVLVRPVRLTETVLLLGGCAVQ